MQSLAIPDGLPLTIIDNLLSPKECTDLINKANTVRNDDDGNKSWHVADTSGIYMRVVMIDKNLAETLFQRIKHLLPETYKGFKPVYLNSHFRFSRYNIGGMFPLHCDGTNLDRDRIDTYGETHSMFTLNIFLNDNFTGGETEFFSRKKDQLLSRYVAKPKTGRATLFYANQLHRGNTVQTPYKYLLRTDVMVTHQP
jgi:hypothetical protein